MCVYHIANSSSTPRVNKSHHHSSCQLAPRTVLLCVLKNEIKECSRVFDFSWWFYTHFSFLIFFVLQWKWKSFEIFLLISCLLCLAVSHSFYYSTRARWVMIMRFLFADLRWTPTAACVWRCHGSTLHTNLPFFWVINFIQFSPVDHLSLTLQAIWLRLAFDMGRLESCW